MSLEAKYQALIDAANGSGVSDLQVRIQDNVLYIDGVAPSTAIKSQMWDIYNQIDPDFRSGDLVLNIQVDESSVEYVEYTVKSGDSLSRIGRNHGISWKLIHEANAELIKNPDLIQIGWNLKIPKV